MRQLGKCDGCRKRKVKCDEQKPSCGGCRKGNRPCTYSYSQGPGFALVIQDPSQMTRYGRSMKNTVVYPLEPSENPEQASFSSLVSNGPSDVPKKLTADTSDLDLRGGVVALDGRSIFQTLVPIRMKPTRVSKKAEAWQRRRFQEHLLHLQHEISLTSHRPSSSETKLAAMFVNMLSPDSAHYQQIYTLGNWVSSIPARIGSSPVVTMAAEFLIHSFGVHKDRTHSKYVLALRTKSRALKELQLGVVTSQKHPSYDVVLATKLHYAAEVLLGVENMHYAIHTLGMIDLLNLGKPSDADEEHFWDIVDNTYIDDITMAMTAGRPSIYDNDVWLSMTHPSVLSDRSFTKIQKVTRSLMHILVQCPRLIVNIRRATREPDNVEVIASAVSLAEELSKLTRLDYLTDYVYSSIRLVKDAVDDEVRDILSYGIYFDDAQTMAICSRYWLLQVMLCGTMDTLHRRFPAEYAFSLLPDPDSFHDEDINAAIQHARVVACLGTDVLPLTFIRTHGPLSASLGAWYRQIRYQASLDTELGAEKLSAARRMKDWVMKNCNVILNHLNISPVDERAWMEALDCMAGEELPDWIPSKVSFGSEDGEMVMQLEYSDCTANGDTRVLGGGGPSRIFSVRNPARFGPQHLREWVKGTGGPSLP